ncbi:unnamed protein product [Phytophthora lilii]|uniref:Unnamed protein product n=1 Tax=Phytophthora lilii TaxID=2077276 RepID=A0A9W6YJ68_9STRA|nr:unnamed protein product [Phytophthora lilii]
MMHPPRGKTRLRHVDRWADDHRDVSSSQALGSTEAAQGTQKNEIGNAARLNVSSQPHLRSFSALFSETQSTGARGYAESTPATAPSRNQDLHQRALSMGGSLSSLNQEIPMGRRATGSSLRTATARSTRAVSVHITSDEDRCQIIERIAGGEQQAGLAREFGVTRAAVCHIQKHQFEILARPVAQQM